MDFEFELTFELWNLDLNNLPMLAESFSKSKIISGIGLIVIGILGRFFLINYVGIPNFEIITALTLVSAVFLGRAWALVVPLSIIAITDAAIGNSPVMIFTWSAFAIIGIFGMLFKKYESRIVIARSRQQAATKQSLFSHITRKIASFPLVARNDSRIVIGLTGVGIISSLFFFLYTNFGWWVMSNMYPRTLDGLIQCYIMGLPFFKNNLIGNLIFVPMASGVVVLINDLRCRKFYGNLSYFK